MVENDINEGNIMHGKKIINNSMISIFYKITMLLLGFITRKIFIVYLGEEILGLNSLYSNLLEFLNLADLGIGVAVQYQLYEPLVKKNNERLSKILTASKMIYNTIGLIVLITGIIISFFIQYLIKDTNYPIWYIQCAFLINVTGISLSYFFVHKRLFLQANEDLGLVNIIDLIAKIVIVVISLVTMMIFRNYFMYLAINALYGLISNLIINYVFTKKHKEVKANAKNIKDEVKTLTANLKNVLPMKVSNYIYNSTDNVIISKVIGLSTVALYSNYMTIINGIMGIEYLLGNVINASFGKIIKEVENLSKVFKYFNIYEYIQFILTSLCVVCLALLGNSFINLWVGNEFIMEKTAFILLVVDFFIHSMYQPAYVMYGATGNFKNDKIITLMSAIMNIIISIILVNFIGLTGVIIGTLITDIYIWIVRTYQIIKKYFNKKYTVYIFKVFIYVISTLISLFIAMFVCEKIHIYNLLFELIIKGIICSIISIIVNYIFTFRSEEFKDCKKYFTKIIKKGNSV